MSSFSPSTADQNAVSKVQSENYFPGSRFQIGQRDDAFEQEANHTANQVSMMSAAPSAVLPMSGHAPSLSPPNVSPYDGSSIQMSGVETEEETISMGPDAGSSLNWSGDDANDSTVQRKVNSIGNSENFATPETTNRIKQSKGQGTSLDKQASAELGQKMGADFSQISVHTDENAIQMSSELGAKAFTHGNDIYFNQGQYNPNSAPGRHLLAHELTHTMQQHGQKPIIQRQDLEADFAGAPAERDAVSGESWPPGMVRVNFPDQRVLVPYHTYRANEVPEEYYNLDMDIENTRMGYAISHGVSMDHIEAEIIEVLAEGPDGAEAKYNESVITIGELRNWAARNNLEARVMIGRISGQFHFLGFDSFQYGRVGVSDNYVESTIGVSGVGRILIVQQFMDAIAQNNIFFAEVGATQDTVLFNNALVTVAKYHKSVVSKERYRLTLRQMINVLIAWNAGQLTPVQVTQLREIVARDTEPTFEEVQGVLENRVDETPAWQRNGPDDPGGGGNAGVLARVATVIRQVFQRMLNLRAVMAVGSFRELQNPMVLEQIISTYQGLVIIEGILYHIAQNAGRIESREITAEPLSLSFPGLQLTSEGRLMLTSRNPQPQLQRTSDDARRGAGSNRLALRGMILPNGLQIGELIVVGGQVEGVVTDTRTGKVVSAYFSGGQWYQITSPRGNNMTIDAQTGRIIPPQFRVIDGYPVPMTPAFFEPSSRARTTMGKFTSPMVRGAVGGLGLIAVANDILAPIGAALQLRRDTIKRSYAEFSFWLRHGATPVMGRWDAEENKEVDYSEGDSADTLDFRYPFIKDIDPVSLRRHLKDRILSYPEYMLFLEMGISMGALTRSGDAYYAVVNRAAYPDVKMYDITAALEETDQQITENMDEELAIMAAFLPNIERLKTCRLALGSATPLYRDVNGRQPVFNSTETLGSDPNVLVQGPGEVNTTSFVEWFFFGQGESRVLVRPANADAMKAALYAKYPIGLSIEEAKEEIERSDRPLIDENEEYGRLITFAAGPGVDGRFGITNYMRNPSNLAYGTIANGELFHFWVNKADLITMPILQLRFYLQSATVLRHDVVQDLLHAMSPLEKQVFREDPFYAYTLMRNFKLSKAELRRMIGHLVSDETLEEFYKSECPNCHRDFVQWHESAPIYDYDMLNNGPDLRNIFEQPDLFNLGTMEPADVEQLQLLIRRLSEAEP